MQVPSDSSNGKRPPKIIYVSFVRLTDRVARDWHVESLVARGAQVEFWDIVELVREAHTNAGMLLAPYLKVLRTRGELEEMLSHPDNRNALCIMLIACNAQFAWVYRLVSAHGLRMVFFDQGAMPFPRRSNLEKIWAYSLAPARLIRILRERATMADLRRSGQIAPFEVCFTAGELLSGSTHHARRIVPVNLADYDNYRRIDRLARPPNPRPYAVFLDVNLAYHADKVVTELAPLDPGTYFRSMNRFFDALQEHHGMEVVIAAHPSADYDVNVFRGRKVVRLKTPELMQHAAFAITHHSNALSYAVLANKPVLFVYTSEMAVLYRTNLMLQIRAQAEYLNAPMLNVDHRSSREQFVAPTLDAERYRQYRYAFTTTRWTENATTADVVWEELRNLG